MTIARFGWRLNLSGSVQRRIQAIQAELQTTAARTDKSMLSLDGMATKDQAATEVVSEQVDAAACLAPIEIDERRDELGPRPSTNGFRASDKGLLPMPTASYIDLLDWTARQFVPGKRGATPESAPGVLERLRIDAETWCELVNNFGRLFSSVAGRPKVVEETRSRIRKRRLNLRQRTREMLVG